MKSLNESVLEALDGRDMEILPYLPYILQDLWEIGASSSAVLHILRKNGFSGEKEFNVLDLGCGKGAVSVALAHKFGWKVLGIDGISAFIDEARFKAKEYEVNRLCTFEVGDIREEVKKRNGFDLVVLGSIGPVFGNHYKTLTSVSRSLKPGRYVLYDDGYIPDASDFRSSSYTTYSEMKKQIELAGMDIVDELIGGLDDMMYSEEFMQEQITRRSNELMLKYPEKKKLFENYIKSQEEEIFLLENKLVCSTLLLKKRE